MDIDRIIALVSSLGTFIASILVFVTIIEMKKQRLNSTAPDLIFREKIFSIFYDESKNIFVWSDQSLDKFNTGNKHHVRIPYLPLEIVNVGLGTAKNIEVKWEYDAKDLIRKINKEDISSLYNIDYNYKSIMINKSKGALLLHHSTELICEEEHLLPCHLYSDTISVLIPSTYLYLINTLFYMLTENNFGQGSLMLENSPNLSATISYEDICGTKYKFNYCMKINLPVVNNVFKTKEKLVTKGTIKLNRVKL